MGTRERREKQKEVVRQEILDAARDLFVLEGYDNVSMRRIAERIDYSPTTIYLYFKDKADLLFNVCEETFAKLAAKSARIMAEPGDPVDKLRRIGRSYVDFGLKHPNHYRVTFVDHPEHGAPFAKTFRGSAGEQAYLLLKSGVEQCLSGKRFKKVDADVASQALWAGVHGITSLLIVHPDFVWKKKKDTINLVVDSMIEGLLR